MSTTARLSLLIFSSYCKAFNFPLRWSNNESIEILNTEKGGVYVESMCIINTWKFGCDISSVKDKILKNKLINAFDFNNPSLYRWFLVALETLKLREMTTSSLSLLTIFVVTWCSLLYEKKYGKHPKQRFPWFFSPKQRILAVKVTETSRLKAS